MQAGAFCSVLYFPVSQAEHSRSVVADGAFETYVPASQLAQVVQEAALATALNVPASQGVQMRSVAGVASARTRVPGTHTLTGAQAEAGLPSSSQVPSPQVVAGLVPPAQYWPIVQAWHSTALVAVPAAVWTEPAAQLPWGRQLDWLSPLEYSPLGHAAHTRSAVADGVLLTKVPAGQVDHDVQAATSGVVLNEPLAQAAHTRSLVVEPSDATKVPGMHDVLATQGVAALRSLSQLPGPHATGGAVPPAQYSPATHAAQIAGEVGVPGAVSTVPAAQVPCGWHEVWLLLAEYSPGGQAAHVRSTVVEGVFVT